MPEFGSCVTLNCAIVPPTGAVYMYLSPFGATWVAIACGWVISADENAKFATALPQPFERLWANASAIEVEPLFCQMQFGQEVLEAVCPGCELNVLTTR